MNRIIYIVLLSVSLALTGCYQDKGNIEYHPVTEVQVSGIQGSYLLNWKENWKVPVTLNYSLGAPGKVAYLWKVDGDTIATTKDLDITVYFPIKKNMVGEYVVTDLDNGVQTIVPFTVTVQSEFKRGWMLLSENEGHSELNFVRTGDHLLYKDIYGEVNKEELSSGAFLLKEHFLDPMVYSETGQVFIACQDAPGYSVDMDGNDFTKVIATKDEFAGGMPADFRPENYESIPAMAGQGIGCDYLISNGKLFTRLLYNGGCFQDGVYTNFPYDFNGGDYRLSPWFMKGHEVWGRYLIGFEEKSGSFVKFENGEIQKLNPASDWGAGIPMINTGMELVSGGVVNYFSEESMGPDKFVLFMKDAQGQVQVISLSINPFEIMMMGSFFYVTESSLKLSDVQENPVVFGGNVINERSRFTFATKGNRLYVATDNKLYAFNHQDKKLEEVRTYDKKIIQIAINRTDYQELGIVFDNGDGTSGFGVADVSYLGQGKLKGELYQVAGKVRDVLYKVGEVMNIEGIGE